MDKKLTLSLNAQVIDRAKRYAKNQETSLSKLIENYLAALTGQENDQTEEITPLVARLVGTVSIPDDYDFKFDYSDYLTKKYQ